MSEDTVRIYHAEVMKPAVLRLQEACGVPTSALVQRWLLVVALMETGLKTRVIGGSSGCLSFYALSPAAVLVVMEHLRTRHAAAAWVRACGVTGSAEQIWRALDGEGGDRLAVGFARLLLRAHGRDMPQSSRDAWQLYRVAWGARHASLERWQIWWDQAEKMVDGAGVRYARIEPA